MNQETDKRLHVIDLCDGVSYDATPELLGKRFINSLLPDSGKPKNQILRISGIADVEEISSQVQNVVTELSSLLPVVVSPHEGSTNFAIKIGADIEIVRTEDFLDFIGNRMTTDNLIVFRGIHPDITLPQKTLEHFAAAFLQLNASNTEDQQVPVVTSDNFNSKKKFPTKVSGHFAKNQRYALVKTVNISATNQTGYGEINRLFGKQDLLRNWLTQTVTDDRFDFLMNITPARWATGDMVRHLNFDNRLLNDSNLLHMLRSLDNRMPVVTEGKKTLGENKVRPWINTGLRRAMTELQLYENREEFLEKTGKLESLYDSYVFPNKSSKWNPRYVSEQDVHELIFLTLQNAKWFNHPYQVDMLIEGLLDRAANLRKLEKEQVLIATQYGEEFRNPVSNIEPMIRSAFDDPEIRFELEKLDIPTTYFTDRL